MLAAALLLAGAISVSVVSKNWQDDTAPAESTETLVQSQKDLSAVQEALLVVQRNVKLAENCRGKWSLQLEGKVLGITMAAEADVVMQSWKEPVETVADMHLDLGVLGDSQVTSYGFAMPGKEEFRQVLVSGKRAKIQFVERETLDKFHGLKLAEVFLEELKDPVYRGMKEENGRKYYVFNGIIDKEGQENILMQNGSLELMLLLLEHHKVADTLGRLLREREDQITELMADAEDMIFTMWVDAQTGYPAWCATDVSYMLNDALGKLTGRNEEEKTPWSGLSLTKAQIILSFDSFGETPHLNIPEVFYEEPQRGKTVS